MKIIGTLLSTSLLVISLNTLASPFPCQNAHFWQKVSAIDSNWTVEQTLINEKGNFVTNAPECENKKTYSYAVNIGQDNQNGFHFAKGSDFNIAFTITAVENSASLPDAKFVSKSCVFIVTATGPAQPDVHITNYNGAKCSSTYNSAKGEIDYTLQ